MTYWYWDGVGHPQTIVVKKGYSVLEMLQVRDYFCVCISIEQACVVDLRHVIPEMKTTSADRLMFVKDDLILPNHMTFHDFIDPNVKGRSGPLFAIEVKEDSRESRVIARDTASIGRVMMRSWYDRNKHIFPASRWEFYDPSRPQS